MDETTLYINKELDLTSSQDYSYLRSKGLEYIQELANKLWTDYNVHDPGITILEALCYAITDLGYRTNYLMKDILAEGTPPGKKPEKQFFTAREILTCNPVTVYDYRKILIDIDGIRNAWLKIADDVVPKIFVDCPDSKLTTDQNIKKVKPVDLLGLYNIVLDLDEDDDLGDLNIYCFERKITTADKEIDIQLSLPAWDVYFEKNELPTEFVFSNLSTSTEAQTYKGVLTAKFSSGDQLFNFTVKFNDVKSGTNKTLIEHELQRTDKDSLSTLYMAMITKAFAIAKDAFTLLQSKRNLCEDFYQLKALDVEEVIVCADIEIDADANTSDILAQIYYAIGKFIKPPVNFYSLKEMYDKGKTTDEIFEGPVLNYGFIDDDELAKSEFRTMIHVSDLIQIIMDVPGVVAVKKILLSSFYKCNLLVDSEKWCLQIGNGHASQLYIDKSKIVFYKGLVPLSVDKTEVQTKLKQLQLLDRPKRLSKDEYDIPIPTGANKQIQNYYSHQNDFPLCYGIGLEGLPLSTDPARKAQAKQLKGFLLFFDRILADYFAQLAHVKDLFSTNPDIQRTYFSHNLLQNKKDNLTDIPNVQNLFKEFVDTLDLSDPAINIDDFSTYESKWNDFINKPENDPPVFERDELQESVSVFEDRRNRFLDHLMARFAEQFSDYVALLYVMDRMKAPWELINDKISFLKNYPDISSNRGKAFNYKDASNVWDTENVSGLKKRVSRLLGINSYIRTNLADCTDSAFEFYQEKDTDSLDEYRFRLKNDEGEIIISSSTKYYKMENAIKEKDRVLIYGLNKENYLIKKSKANTFYIEIIDDTGEIIARTIRFFKVIEDAEAFVDKIISFLENITIECEGFHLIEHILLRPRQASDELLTVCVNKECNNCMGFIDPYSFRVTVVAPYWPGRFKNMDFRRLFESTIRMEAPAYVHIKICWVEKEPLKNFETKYSAWLNELAKENPDQTQLSNRQAKLIKALEDLRSVYPESLLFDCGAVEQPNVTLLNNSILGSTKEEENGNM